MSGAPQPSYKLIHGIKVTRHEQEHDAPEQNEATLTQGVIYNYYDDIHEEPDDLEIPRYQLS